MQSEVVSWHRPVIAFNIFLRLYEVRHLVFARLNSKDWQILPIFIPVALLHCSDALIPHLSRAAIEPVVMLLLDMKYELVIFVFSALRQSLYFFECYFSLHRCLFEIADSRSCDEEVSCLFHMRIFAAVLLQLTGEDNLF